MPTAPGPGTSAGPVARARALARRPSSLPVVLAAASLVLSFVRMPWPSFWLDEAATVTMVERTPAQLVATLHEIDLVHGSYYLLLTPWAALAGTSEVELRTPSAVALAVACAGFVLLVRDVSGDRVAWIAGTAFVLLPGLSWTGIEARSYVVVVALVVWAVWALNRALHDRRRRWWVLFTVLVVLSVLMNVLAILMAVPYLVAGLAARRLRPTLVAVGAAVLVVAPFAWVASTQVGQVAWIDIGPAQLAYQVVVGQVFLGQRFEPGPVTILAGLVLAALLAVLALAAVRTRADRRFAVDTALSWLLVPTLALALPVLAGVQLYQERYVAYAAPAACWLAALGWTAARRPARLATAVGTVAVLAALLPLVGQAGAQAKNGEDFRALADLAPGNTAVVFATDEARGIAIAYPDRFAGLADLALRTSGPESATLWGEQRLPADLALQGRVVVYVDSRPEESGRRAVEERVAAEGCVALRSVERRTWTGTTYDCG